MQEVLELREALREIAIIKEVIFGMIIFMAVEAVILMGLMYELNKR